ncbi:MAG: hypothetical protein H5U02_01800 [Clostridia bacterium]|nr:hypothetical protein [Clostridia bacterium]
MIFLRLPDHLVVLTPGEVMTALQARPEIWERGIKRGKAHIRAMRRAQRPGKGREVRPNT